MASGSPSAGCSLLGRRAPRGTGSRRPRCRARTRRGRYLQRALQRLDRAGRERAEGLAGPEPAAQCFASTFDVPGRARALLRARRRIFTTHGSPSRHGVHQPHDSRAKNSLDVAQHRARSGRSVVDHGHQCRCPCGCRPSGSCRSPSRGRGARASGSRSRRRPGSQAASCEPVAHAAGVLLEDLAHRRAHRQLPQPGRFTRAATRRRAWCRRPCSPRESALNHVRAVARRCAARLHSVSTLLTMVGLPQAPAICGNGGFARGLRAPALERVDQRGFLAADVAAGAECARTSSKLQPVPSMSRAEVAGGVAPRRSPVCSRLRRQHVLAAQEDVAAWSASIA